MSHRIASELRSCIYARRPPFPLPRAAWSTGSHVRLLLNTRNYNSGTTTIRKERASVRAGVLSAPRVIPPHILKPNYKTTQFDDDQYNDENHGGSEQFITIWSPKEIEKIRSSGHLARRVLDFAGSLVKVGVTTDEIDSLVHDFIILAGAYPSPLGYGNPPFPKSICTSVNEIFCHGIPDSRPLESGDIINVDVSIFLDGFHGDCSATFLVGVVDEKAKKLVEVTKQCLEAAINICGPGVPFNKIGTTIERLANRHGFQVVPDFAGHGIGRDFHTAPYIFHFANDDGGVMQPGMVFTIEPILTEGPVEYITWDDMWTISSLTLDRSAQFEHQILITPKGAEILTDNSEI